MILKVTGIVIAILSFILLFMGAQLVAAGVLLPTRSLLWSCWSRQP